MQTMKELIDTGFFPTDPETGFTLVPINGDGEGYEGNAMIFTTDAPGEYPIVGTGPRGYAQQWDEDGIGREDFGDGSVAINVHDYSLRMPETEYFIKFMVIDADDTVIGTFDTRDEAMRSYIPDGGQMVIVDGQRYVSEPLEQPTGFLFDAERVPDFDAISLQQAEVPFGGFYRGPLNILGL
jgi:hypothetical protein